MQPLLLTNARLVDPATGYDGPGGIFIDENGCIEGAGVALFDMAAPDGVRTVDCGGHVLGPGLVDMRVFLGEPGERHKESFRSAGEAAVAGGVTTIAMQPSTNPPLDERSMIEFVIRRASESSPCRVVPMAALTKGLQGNEMAEYGFLQDAGAVAFTDGNRAVTNPVIFRRCLSYAHSLGALVCHHAQEPHFSALGCASEGLFASQKGLPEIPAEAELIMLERDINLVRMTDARYHVSQITTRAALEVLRRAREEGLPVSASASVNHAALNEYDIADFRTFAKLTPPLRSEDDRLAVVEALREGLIDTLVSSHRPHDEESKRLPFAQAAAGAIGVETLLPVALGMHHEGQIPLVALWERLSTAPARLLGLEGGTLARGAPADLALVDISAAWIIRRKALRSRAKNSPFDGKGVQGRVRKTFVGGVNVFEAAGDEHYDP